MALTICEECGRAISDRAASCPQCGMPRQPSPTETWPAYQRPRAQPSPTRRRMVLVASVSMGAALILILAIALLSGPDHKTAPANRPTSAQHNVRR